MLTGKEGNKRKKEQIYTVKYRQTKKIYIHEKLTARGKENRKGKQRNKCRKNNRFKKLKIKIKKEKERKKGKLHRTTKDQCRGRGL